MPAYRRKRRADDGKFLPKDEKLWRGLIKAARYQTRAPLAPTDTLTKAAHRCEKAVPPRAHISLFRSLAALALAFWRVPAADRPARAADLLTVVDACQAALDALPTEGPPLRRDIFG